jgi:NDP-sugar pyrophosphorylase family protein
LNVRAVLLAAGRGTRLAAAGHNVPKILAPVAGRPLLEHQLEYLRRQGVTDVAINIHHQADLVEAALRDISSPVGVTVSREPELLGTAGALNPLRPWLTEPFLVLYGDVLTDVDLRALYRAQCADAAVATLVVHPLDDVEGKGVCSVDAEGRITSFVEKGAREPGLVNAGVHAVDPVVLEHIPPGFSDFGHDIWPQLLADGRTLRAYPWNGYVRDIGTSASLARAESELIAGALAW